MGFAPDRIRPKPAINHQCSRGGNDNLTLRLSRSLTMAPPQAFARFDASPSLQPMIAASSALLAGLRRSRSAASPPRLDLSRQVPILRTCRVSAKV